jgi:hypothetical protein
MASAYTIAMSCSGLPPCIAVTSAFLGLLGLDFGLSRQQAGPLDFQFRETFLMVWVLEIETFDQDVVEGQIIFDIL